MKKIILLLMFLLVFTGCGKTKGDYVAEKVADCESKSFYYDNHGGYCFKLEPYCERICSRLFDEYTNTWGADGADDKISTMIYQCFNDCLERNTN